MANLKKKLMAAAMSLMTLTASHLSTVQSLHAAAEDAKGKYVSEVFIAYGKSEDDAKKWLTDHGWEPVDGNFNAGKESYWDRNEKVATVMGIHRTNDPNEAITDMAVMNMGVKGSEGYSFTKYEDVVKQKKAEIDEFLDCFTPVLQEYRDNANGNGGDAGRARAEYVRNILNHLVDGDPNDENAANDTGKPLGDLLMQPTRREMGDDAYNKDKANHADLQQIVLESSGDAVLAIEQALAMATDTAEDTWVDRLSEISLDLMISEPGLYLPQYEGHTLSQSAALNALNAKYGDAAQMLADDYYTVQQELIFYDAFMESIKDWYAESQGKSAADYDSVTDEMLEAYFLDLNAKDAERFNEESQKFSDAFLIYAILYGTEYEGDWGETLGDFFNPDDGENYGEDPDNFLPFAAALSEGQRAGLKFLSLKVLIRLATGSEKAAYADLPDISELTGNTDSISVYSGINRKIFRRGVALTNEALMHKNLAQDDPFGNLWDFKGALNIAAYTMAAVGCLALAAGTAVVMMAKTSAVPLIEDGAEAARASLQALRDAYANRIAQANDMGLTGRARELFVGRSRDDIRKVSGGLSSTTGRVLMGIGGALMLAAAGYKIYQYTQYYSRKFTVIPMMIVDEADIVKPVLGADGKPILDENGQEMTSIEFDQYVYYDVVKCNRPEVGDIGDWQDGVDKYDEWGCGDANDLNGDYGKQWLSLYTVKSPSKGNPILADSLKLQYGSNKAPSDASKKLHFFTQSFAANLADTAYCFDDKKGGIYFFWEEDAKVFASNTASTFSGGTLALTGIGGLAIGILGTTLVMMLKKRKAEKPEAPAAA